MPDRLRRFAADGRVGLISILVGAPVKRAHITIRSDETGGIEDPALDQRLQPGQLSRIEISCSA